MSLFVVFIAAGTDNKAMLSFDRQYAEAALAQPLSEGLLADAGIMPGMRVLVLGRGVCDLALLVAERVGGHGCVVVAHDDPCLVARARQRAAAEGFDGASFRTTALDAVVLDGSFDAVIGRFYLAHERDPIAALRRAAQTVHDGGRIAFQEWHYESMLWSDTSDWPLLPLYRACARWVVDALRRSGVHVNMGLRLANCFSAAGLCVPALSTDLRTVHGENSLGFGFFAAMLHELLPALADCGIAAADVDAETFASRLERETNDARGHAFLPLQVAAWTRAKAELQATMAAG